MKNRVKNVLSALLETFSHLVYPPLCLYCSNRLEQPGVLFCHSCVELLEFIQPEERCRYCFGEMTTTESGVCTGCLKQPPVLTRVAAAFDYIGPAASLVKQLKYGQRPHLAQSAAALLVAQFSRLDWPLPDLIVPVPMPRLRKLFRGYNQSVLIAQELGKLLQCPVVQPLRRRSGDFSQAGLSLEQRQALTGSNLTLLEANLIQDRHVLVVDDVMTSGATLRRCGEALLGGCPKAIYGLTICRATR